MKYLCIRNGKNKGVYQAENDTEWKELYKMVKNGTSSRVFKESEKAAALKWTGVKEVANRKQEVVQEIVQGKNQKKEKSEKKEKIQENNVFKNLLKMAKSFDTTFVKLTLTTGCELIIPIKEFCFFEYLTYFANFSTDIRQLENNEYQVSVSSVYLQNRNNVDNIQTLFHKKYQEIILEYQRKKQDYWYGNRIYKIPTEIELFKQTLEIVKDSILKNYCKFNYDFCSSVQYTEQNQFIFIKNVIKEMNIEPDRNSDNYLYLTYKPMIINKNEIVKIEPYIDSKIQSFIITDNTYSSVLKEFKEKVKKEEK